MSVGHEGAATADRVRRRAAGLRWAAGAAVVGMVLLAGCSGNSNDTTALVVSGALSPSVAPSPSLPPPPTTSPLSGRKGGIDAPILVVKLDNTPSAQPHVGVVKADVVYVEPVEWGLTRLAAVFATQLPDVVGPVRSARISDIQIFAPLGDVAFVYSGAQRKLHPKLAAASWHAVSEDLSSPGFFRDPYRYSPYNLMAQPKRIIETSGATATTHDIGWVFDEEAPDGGRAAKTMTARWPNARMQFRWNEDVGRYDIWMDGRQARDTLKPGVQRASTVIVQYVKETDSGYGDKFGGRTPLSKTIGSGKGWVLRDGRAHKISWQRESSGQPTAYLDADGEPIAFDPGQVWILLKDRTKKVEFE